MRYFVFFITFDLTKGGASASLALSLVAPLYQALNIIC